MFSKSCKGQVQVGVDLGEGLGFGSWIAPRVARAIVCADACEFCDAGLDQDPVEREIAQSVFNHHRGASFSGAVHVEPMGT